MSLMQSLIQKYLTAQPQDPEQVRAGGFNPNGQPMNKVKFDAPGPTINDMMMKIKHPAKNLMQPAMSNPKDNPPDPNFPTSGIIPSLAGGSHFRPKMNVDQSSLGGLDPSAAPPGAGAPPPGAGGLPTSSGPSLPPLAPLGSPASSTIAGSGLPPTPRPAVPPPAPMSTPGSPMMGATPDQGIQGDNMAEPTPLEQQALPSSDNPQMGQSPLGQSPQMAVNTPPTPNEGHGDIVSMIKRLLHRHPNG